MSRLLKLCSVFLLTFVLVLQVGCKEEKESPISEQKSIVDEVPESFIDVYYCHNSDVELIYDAYQIKQLDNINASVEEALVYISTHKFGDDEESFFQEGIVYTGFVINERNELTVNLKLDKDSYDSIDYYLEKAALCSTLFQIKDVNSIKIVLDRIDNVNLESDTYNQKSFFYYNANGAFNVDERVVLYIPNEDGSMVIRTEVEVSIDYMTSIESLIMEQLKSYSCIPKGTAINSVFVSNGICYLDLNMNFVDVSDVNSEVVVYSIVNSLTSMPDIDKVQFYIDGQIVGYYRETVKIDVPLYFNEKIVE